MSKNNLLVGLIVICFFIIGFVLYTNLRGDPEVQKALNEGLRADVACANPECNWTSGEFRAQPDDNDWPKKCPECGELTLYRSEKCYKCQEMVILKPSANGGIYCPNCKTMLLEPPAKR